MKRARAASESSSKRWNFDWITNCQEFLNIEMGHMRWELNQEGFKIKKALSDIRHLTFEI